MPCERSRRTTGVFATPKPDARVSGRASHVARDLTAIGSTVFNCCSENQHAVGETIVNRSQSREADEQTRVRLLETLLADASLINRLASMPADEKTIAVTIDGNNTSFSHPDIARSESQVDQTETVQWTPEFPLPGPQPAPEGFVPQRKVSSLGDGNHEVSEYRLVGELGSGGTAHVYQAHQRAVDREVAIKVLRDELAEDPKSRARFLTEARLIGGLDHPNVIALHEVCLDDTGKLFYSMKRIDGTSWDQQIGDLSLQQNVSILLRVADAIRYAHSRGLIHRDIKPENVMLGKFGEVLLADWGLAVSRTDDDHPITEQTIGGTPAYMAPELAVGDYRAISYPTDVYLLGAILFQILTGYPPHHGETLLRCITSAAHNEIRPTRVEGELMDIAMKAMSSAPQDRYQTVDELMDAINDQRQHEESERLVKLARARFYDDTPEDRLEDFRVADALLREALVIWPENRRAQEVFVELNIEFARAAKAKGDLELALTLYETAGQSDSEAAARIRRELQHRQNAGQRVARYSALFTQLPEAGLLGDISTGRVVEANEMFGELFGYDQKDIVGKRMDELGVWVCEKQRLAFVTKIQNDHRVDNFEATMQHTDGFQIDVLISARKTTINGEDMVVSTLRNISDRKETERALQKNQRLLADMQKLAGLGTWLYDVSTQSVQWSDEAYHLAGRVPDEGIPSQREYLQLIHPDDRKILTEAIRNAVEHIASFAIRIRQRGFSGAYQELLIRGQPIQDASGKTVEVYGVLIPQLC